MQLPGVPSRTPSPRNKGVPPGESIPKQPISGPPGYEEGPTPASQPGYKGIPSMVALTFVQMIGYFVSPIPSLRTAQQAPILRCIWCMRLWSMVTSSLAPGPLPPVYCAEGTCANCASHSSLGGGGGGGGGGVGQACSSSATRTTQQWLVRFPMLGIPWPAICCQL